MPDYWPMPVGFDLRSVFLVGGDGWTAAVLPLVLTSPTVSGTPAYIKDPDVPEGVLEPAIAASTPVYDNAGQSIGGVEGMEIDPASGRITRVIVRRGVIFRRETAIPASVIASVGDRITLSVGADEVILYNVAVIGLRPNVWVLGADVVFALLSSASRAAPRARGSLALKYPSLARADARRTRSARG